MTRFDLKQILEHMDEITSGGGYHIRVQTKGGWTTAGAHLGLNHTKPYLTLRLDLENAENPGYAMIPVANIIAVELCPA